MHLHCELNESECDLAKKWGPQEQLRIGFEQIINDTVCSDQQLI